MHCVTVNCSCVIRRQLSQ